MRIFHPVKTASNKRGFTIFELLIVIAIIGIMSSVTVSVLGGVRSEAVIAASRSFEDQMYQGYGADAVAVWPFDEGTSTVAHDISGHHSDLTLAGDASVIWTAPAKAFHGASALSFSNGDPLPASGNIADLDLSNGSISFWTNMTTAFASGIFCNNTGVYNQFCILDEGYRGTFIGFDWDGGGSTREVSTSFDPRLFSGIWTYVAVTWNVPASSTTGTAKIYINGKEAASVSDYYPPTNFPAPYPICVGGDCWNDNIHGIVDEMRVYSQSLQTGEIEKLYAEELPEHELTERWPSINSANAI